MNKPDVELIQSIFKTANGKKALEILQNMAFFNTSIIGPSPELTYANEGQRSFMLRLTKIINTDIKEVKKVSVADAGNFFKT